MIVEPPEGGLEYEDHRMPLGKLSAEVESNGRTLRFEFPNATLVTRHIEPPLIPFDPIGWYLGKSRSDAWIEVDAFDGEGSRYMVIFSDPGASS